MCFLNIVTSGYAVGAQCREGVALGNRLPMSRVPTQLSDTTVGLLPEHPLHVDLLSSPKVPAGVDCWVLTHPWACVLFSVAVLEVCQFSRDASVAEAWLIAQEPYLASQDFGHTVDSVEKLIKRHEAFEKSTASWAERFDALKRPTAVSRDLGRRTALP